MQLSEAIRLGAMMKPQGFPGGGDSSCALIAACEAVGQPEAMTTSAGLRALFPQVYDSPATCPECGRVFRYATGCIGVCLNDLHRWTREQIADWVEMMFERRIEAAQRQSAVDPVEREARSNHHCLTTRG